MEFFIILLLPLIVALGLLPRAWAGDPRPAYVAATISLTLGLIFIIATFVVPRPYWGEYGHGDGFGMLGLMLSGMIAIAAALALTLVTCLTAWAGRRYRSRRPDY